MLNNCKEKKCNKEKTGVVYKINCQNYDQSYIGETKKMLKIELPNTKEIFELNTKIL